MTERIHLWAIQLGTAALLAMGALAVAAGAASAGSATTIYNNIPNPHPKDLVSQSFEATSTSEFGGQVEFAGTARSEPTVKVALSSYACQTGTSSTCKSAMNSRFQWPITLNVYEVGAGGTIGPRIATDTQTFSIPYRPSSSVKCPETIEGKGWGKECDLGILSRISFKLKRVTLPTTAIIAVAFNTENDGAAPTGEAGPYNSLNVSVSSSYMYNEGTKGWEFTALPLLVGADPLPADAYLSSTSGGAYCDGGASGTGSFRLDTGCWSGLQPELEVAAKS